MSAFKKAALILLILCSCVGCDQVTKSLAREHLALNRVQGRAVARTPFVKRASLGICEQ